MAVWPTVINWPQSITGNGYAFHLREGENIMRKFALSLALLFVFLRPAFSHTLTIFAAASLQSAAERITQIYTSQTGTKFITNFDSSGTLKTQIMEGAECDIFISAAQKQMNALESEGLIDPSARVNLLENKIVLASSKINPAKIESFADLGTDKLTLIALGNSDVPAGAYAQEILTAMGLWDALNNAGKISFAGNVTEAALQVREGAADCGIIYATDAMTHGLKVIAFPPAGTLKTPVIYPAAVISRSANKDEAVKFLKFLQDSEARKIFESFGFTPAK